VLRQYGSDHYDVVPPDTANVFFVSGFAASTNTAAIKAWFSTAGNTRIRWRDDTSVFVTVEDCAKASQVRLGPAEGYRIDRYSDWKSGGMVAQQWHSICMRWSTWVTLVCARWLCGFCSRTLAQTPKNRRLRQ
jgi:hypothetical protein